MRNPKPDLVLADNDRQALERISCSRNESASRVQRATILLMYASGTSITEITNRLDATRPLVYRAIDKALAFGPLASLGDTSVPAGVRVIDDAAKSWVISLACQRPTDLGYAAETWTYSSLVTHIRSHADGSAAPLLEESE